MLSKNFSLCWHVSKEWLMLERVSFVIWSQHIIITKFWTKHPIFRSQFTGWDPPKTISSTCYTYYHARDQPAAITISIPLPLAIFSWPEPELEVRPQTAFVSPSRNAFVPIHRVFICAPYPSSLPSPFNHLPALCTTDNNYMEFFHP